MSIFIGVERFFFFFIPSVTPSNGIVTTFDSTSGLKAQNYKSVPVYPPREEGCDFDTLYYRQRGNTSYIPSPWITVPVEFLNTEVSFETFNEREMLTINYNWKKKPPTPSNIIIITIIHNNQSHKHDELWIMTVCVPKRFGHVTVTTENTVNVVL